MDDEAVRPESSSEDIAEPEHVDFMLADLESLVQSGEAERAVLKARALVDRVRDAPPARTDVRAMSLLAGAFTQLGHYGDAVRLLTEAEHRASTLGLRAEATRMQVTAAGVLAADGDLRGASERMRSVRRTLESLMRQPDDAVLKAAHNFAFVSTDLGLHTVAEQWFERILYVRDNFASPVTALHTLSAYARLKVEMGLVSRYLGREQDSVRQFAESARLGNLLATQADQPVWRQTGTAFVALAEAQVGRPVDLSSEKRTFEEIIGVQTNKHLRCVVQVALASSAACRGAWPVVLDECAVGLPLTDDVGFTLLGVELRRLAAVSARAVGDRAKAEHHELEQESKWRSYEWSSRLRAAEFVAS